MLFDKKMKGLNFMKLITRKVLKQLKVYAEIMNNTKLSDNEAARLLITLNNLSDRDVNIFDRKVSLLLDDKTYAEIYIINHAKFDDVKRIKVSNTDVLLTVCDFPCALLCRSDTDMKKYSSVRYLLNHNVIHSYANDSVKINTI